MKTVASIRKRLFRLFGICPLRHTLLLVSACIILLHLIIRGNQALMAYLSDNALRPVHRALATFNSHFSFSVAELLIGMYAAFMLAFVLVSLIWLIRAEHKVITGYRLAVTLASFAAGVYALFCLMWGTYYYGGDFIGRSGVENEPVSVRELADATRYFASLAKKYSALIPRNENGEADFDRVKILGSSSEVFKNVESLFPCLEAPDVEAKGFYFSRALSYLDLTGFFFPFTGEANVNTDFPSALFPFTVAHELSHQRGVAREHEANFVAVVACLEYGESEYVYSGALAAYTYLSKALYDADCGTYEEIYLTLDEGIIADLHSSGEYWQQLETPVQQISGSVYESFLYSYDQDLGLKSYGACVDLLVNYYGE